MNTPFFFSLAPKYFLMLVRILREKNAYVNFFSIMLARGYQETFRKISFLRISSYNARQMEFWSGYR
jgi:hypothetical protein